MSFIAALSAIILTNVTDVSCAARTNQIGSAFDLSPISVKKYLSAIFTKIGAANRTEAAAIALKKHLLKI